MICFTKKIIISILFLFLALPAFCEITEPITYSIEGGISFDWISKSQMQRDENIQQVQNLVFNENTITKYSKKEFKAKYAEFLKDKNHLANYEEISAGKKEDEQAKYCAFKIYNDTIMVMYAIQYKKDLKHVYYYDALGKLCLIDVFAGNFPQYPHAAYQYKVNGELQAAYYYNSKDDQYAFDANKKFRGRWYKENYYNRKAKVIITRTSW